MYILLTIYPGIYPNDQIIAPPITGKAVSKVVTPKPIIGIGQAAYHLASLTSTKFNILTTLAVSVPVIEKYELLSPVRVKLLTHWKKFRLLTERETEKKNQKLRSFESFENLKMVRFNICSHHSLRVCVCVCSVCWE